MRTLHVRQLHRRFVADRPTESKHLKVSKHSVQPLATVRKADTCTMLVTDGFQQQVSCVQKLHRRLQAARTVSPVPP